MTCHNIILRHRNFCPKIYLMINLRTLSVNRGPQNSSGLEFKVAYIRVCRKVQLNGSV